MENKNGKGETFDSLVMIVVLIIVGVLGTTPHSQCKEPNKMAGKARIPREN